MENLIAFAEVAGAIIAAMGLAMGIEWMTLNGLMRAMPVQRSKASQAISAAANSNMGNPMTVKVRPRNCAALTMFPH